MGKASTEQAEDRRNAKMLQAPVAMDRAKERLDEAVSQLHLRLL